MLRLAYWKFLKTIWRYTIWRYVVFPGYGDHSFLINIVSSLSNNMRTFTDVSCMYSKGCDSRYHLWETKSNRFTGETNSAEINHCPTPYTIQIYHDTLKTSLGIHTSQFRNEFPCNYVIFTHFPPMIAWNTSPGLPTSRIRKSSHVLTDETDDRAQNLSFSHMCTLNQQLWVQHNWNNICSFPMNDSLKHFPWTTYKMNPQENQRSYLWN
jgi:hypothetical protein